MSENISSNFCQLIAKPIVNDNTFVLNCHKYK